MQHVERIAHGSVAGFLHVPPGSPVAGTALTHGAGANCESKLLIAVADALTAAGFSVLRYDLPFRKCKRFGPPLPANAAEDRNGIREAAVWMRSNIANRLILAGHSYGGRQTSIVASEDPTLADGLLLLSYPLHPPNKPDQLRTVHFAALKTPSLFVHGRIPSGQSRNSARRCT